MTDDVEVTNDIIKATNWQTEVKKEAFESLYPFHKKLEEFYLNYDKEKERRIYYERRSKQFENQPIPKNKVITLTTQIKSFIAMFLNSPHSTHRYYGELLDAHKTRIFAEDHFPLPYYVSAYGLYMLERSFAKKELDSLYKKFKYHILLLLRIDVAGNAIPNFNSKQINSYSQQIMDVLWDDQKSLQIFKSSIDKIARALKQPRQSDRYYADRLKQFTLNLTSLPELEYDSGIIKYYNTLRGFGFIGRETGSDIWVHIRCVENASELRPGQQVEFVIEETPKGLQAKKLRVM